MRRSFLKSLLARSPDTHKGDYGHVLIVSGSVGLTGAPVLCAWGALRAGAGLVSLGVPESVYFIVASQLTEAMVHPLPESPQGGFSLVSLGALRPLIQKADALAVGPGLSKNPATLSAVRRLITTTQLPMVLDADGIAAFSGGFRRQLLKAKGPVVITPHPGEMAGFLGSSIQAVQRRRLATALEVARKFKVTVVLKGHRTVVASPTGRRFVNSTGNPGMASGGVGDLLTGIITALLGQGLGPFEAAQWGVVLHGLAGDLAARRVGQVGLVAQDLLAEIPTVLRRLVR